MKKTLAYLFLLVTFFVNAQEKLSLEDCYRLTSNHYPVAGQQALLDEQMGIDLSAISSEKLPQFDLSTQATYQSDVTEVPLANAGIKPLNNDQYKATLTANQLIWSDGLISATENAKKLEYKTKQQQVKVTLYQLKRQVNELYFSILLLQEKRNLLKVKAEQLEARLKEVRSGIVNGTVLPASDKVLEAEIVKIQQQGIEVDHSIESLVFTLSQFTGRDLPSDILLEPISVQLESSGTLRRPELDLYSLKREQLQASEQLLAKENSPKIIGFATGGYGNPGLNMLDNSFQPFYIVGLQLNWHILDWNKNKKKRESLKLTSKIIDNEATTFKFNNDVELGQQLNEISKITALIDSDEHIVQLREEILSTANSQLRNGVITSSEYVTELTHLFEAENTLATHKIQLELAKANYNVIKGN